MKNLEKDLYIKHAKRLAAIINAKSSFVPYLTRKDFNLVLKKELNILSECEKLFPKVDIETKLTSKALVKELNTLTKDKFTLDEKLNYEDETDLIDGINYLYTFCNNMFKVNLDDLVAGKNITATDPKIDLRAKPDFDDHSPKMNSNFAFAGGGIPLAATPYENPYWIGKAYAKLEQDMKQGKFYRYKTKPRIMPIVKWCSIILTILVALSLLISAIFGFIDNTVCLFSPASGEEGNVSMTMNAVFYLVAAGFGVYPLIMVMKTMVGKLGHNDNFRYYMNWGFILMFLILSVLFGLMDTITVWRLEVGSASIGTIQGTAFIGLRISLILVLAFSGLDGITLIIGGVNNPKPDAEAVERKIREYIDLFSQESGQMPVPPKGADVQEPTKVEDPDKAKGETKK